MFISVIPALKMPYGHCFFDYELKDGSVHVGDLILIPFRQKSIPGLVAKISPNSQYAEKTIAIANPKKIFKFPEVLVEFCMQAARETFTSPPTMLNAWLRVVPKRLDNFEAHVMAKNTIRPNHAQKIVKIYAINRYTSEQGILVQIEKEQANGRILILTPWQNRVDFLSKRLGIKGLHAQTAMAGAWKTWSAFLNRPNGILVATRLGAWLAGAADLVIIDEPENDDYKQDEQTPRYDARRLVNLAAEIRPELRIISLGTTPRLDDVKENRDNLTEFDIPANVLYSAFAKQIGSPIETITQPVFDAIQQAVENKRSVRILHPVLGMRGRLRCADCGWVLTCSNCNTGMNNMQSFALCRRCNKSEPIPSVCPKCQGTDLTKAALGCQALSVLLNKHFPNADLQVLDLHEWQTNTLPPKSLIVITNLMRVGGYSEDIRRKERLIIAYRRIAAQSCVAKCDMLVQGDADLISEAPNWLNTAGLITALCAEFADRKAFQYPPANVLAKLIVPGDVAKMETITKQLTNICLKTDWTLRGPYPVEFRSKTQDSRCVYHLLPPTTKKRSELIDDLAVLTAYGIIDLDPIAFFC